jgi:hypothetical protein
MQALPIWSAGILINWPMEIRTWRHQQSFAVVPLVKAHWLGSPQIGQIDLSVSFIAFNPTYRGLQFNQGFVILRTERPF